MKKAMMIVAIIGVLAMAGVARAEIVSHWKLDEAAGATTAVDSVSCFDLTAGSPAPTFGVAAVANTGVSLSGTGGASLAGGSFHAELNPASFTVSCWYNPDSAIDAGYMVWNNGGSPTAGYALAQDDYWDPGNNLGFLTGGGGAGWDVVTKAIPGGAGNWYHVVGTYDDVAQMKTLYVSPLGGAFDASPATQNVVVDQLVPADNTTFDFGYYPGFDEDDVQVYNTALSAADVEWLFNNPGSALGGIVPEPCGLGLIGLALLAVRRKRS